MVSQKLISLCSISGLVCVSNVFAAPGNENRNNIPGTEYRVHDMKRPQPRIIETGGAVVVKPPSDAKVLFDGSNLDAWASVGGGKAEWEVKDGVMIAAKRDLISKESFGPIQLHFEFKLGAEREVDGQKGGNSGCFLMGLYEIQVLQSHNNETYPDGQAGALYGQLPPLVNASSPQGEWNSYDVFFTPPIYEDEKVRKPAMVTVIHNGVVVQNGEAYIGPTKHKTVAEYPAEHPKEGPLRFQFHKDPMQYRNVWVRPLGERDQ